MIQLFRFLLTVFLSALFFTFFEPSSSASMAIDRVENNKIFLKSTLESKSPPPPLETSLHQIIPFSLLNQKGKSRYILFQAQNCVECDQNDAQIHLMSIDGKKHHRFTHPGKITDQKTGRTIHKSRSFFGHCLPKKGDVYISFQKDKIDRWRYLQSSVLLVEITDDGIEEKLIIPFRKRPKLRTVIRQVRKNECQEIKGLNRKTSHFSLKKKEAE